MLPRLSDPATRFAAKAPTYVAFLLVILCVMVYARGLNGPFIFDDKTAIEYSMHIRSLWPLSKAMSAADETAAAGRPVLCLSLALNHAVHGLDVRGYHIVNIALHVGSALLLMAIVARTLGHASDPSRGLSMSSCEAPDVRGFGRPQPSACRIIAAVAALLWAMHPLQTESVQYVIQRSELLLAFFLFLTLYAFIRGREGRRSWQVLSIIACLLGVGSKETMAVAPLLVLLYDRTFMSGSFGAALRRSRWLYAGLFATWLPLAWLVAQGPRDLSVGPREGITVWNYLLTQTGVLVHYLRLSIWPRPLAIVYGWPIARSITEVVLPGLVILSLLAITVRGLWRNAWYGFVGAWCFLILAPTSSVLPMTFEIVAERRMYLPLAALIPVTVAALARIRFRYVPQFRIAAATAVVLLLSSMTWLRVGDYRSEKAIWTDAVAKQPASHLAQHNYGHALQQSGDLDGAIRHYQLALDINANYRPSWLNLANSLVLKWRFDEAIATYRKLLEMEPRYPPAHNNLGLLLAQSGRPDEAMVHFAEAVHVYPQYYDARSNLASLLIDKGQHDAARRHLQQVLAESPSHYYAKAQLKRLEDLEAGVAAVEP